MNLWLRMTKKHFSKMSDPESGILQYLCKYSMTDCKKKKEKKGYSEEKGQLEDIHDLI